jgi:exo-beta-1,3-glucanase (GH17 family)
VGNETQVSWSDHRSPMDILIGYVREVRAGTTVPVTVADDFNFWNKPESRELAREVDFITMHAHPLWNGLDVAGALGWTRKTYEEVCAIHPDRVVVLGEAGWATQHGKRGDQGTLIRGRTGEAEQAAFFDAFTAWSREDRVPTFWFEAFDENWKGGDASDEVENWGLFRADRSPKRAVAP